jgi:acyl carrier protein
VTSWDSRQGDPRHSVPIGRPIANTQVYVLDEMRQPVPIGIPGELYVGGAGLARGYRNRPEMTAERFVPDPFSGRPGARLFKTGDRARFLADGQLEYLGRNDDQVKIRGYRIELGEIEAALAAHAFVDRAVAAVRGVSSGEPRLVAYVVPREEGEVSSAALRAFLETRLPAFMIPAAFVFLEALPLTPSGKIDRKSLPAPEAVRPELERPFVAPSSDTEQALAEIWKEVLGLDRVGLHDDFFALGGHSLLLIQVSSRLRKSLAVELPLRTFFESPTIAGLARAVEGADRAPRESGPAIVPAPAGAPLPLSFAQQRLWLIEQLDPGNTGYLIRRAYRLTGALRVEFLRQAIRGVAARHASLRTRFLSADGGALQEILPAERVTVPFEQVDLTSLPAEQKDAEASRRAAAEGQWPFDLSRAPLLRVVLLRLGPE